MKIYVVTELDLVPWRAMNWDEAFFEMEDMRQRRKAALEAVSGSRGPWRRKKI